MRRALDAARQLIREHGVTYNVYGDPRGLGRPWLLDPIPLLISAEDSDALQAGLVQRARLLELILAECFFSSKASWMRLSALGEVLPKPNFMHWFPWSIRMCTSC